MNHKWIANNTFCPEDNQYKYFECTKCGLIRADHIYMSKDNNIKPLYGGRPFMFSIKEINCNDFLMRQVLE